MEPKSTSSRFNPQLAKVVAAVVVALFAAALIVAFANRPATINATDTFTNSGFSREAVVTVGPTGFEPATLTIATHTRVTWKTSDGKMHHLVLNDIDQQDGPATDASNDPQLPSGTEIDATGSLKHVFEKPNTYVFHDQENPTANLSVTVK